MAQLARPTTDTTRGNWTEDDGTTVSIFDQIDEVTADDADFIQTGLTPVNEPFVTKLSALEDPISSTGHTLRYRLGKSATGGDQINITVELRQGYVNESTLGTLIASGLTTPSGPLGTDGTSGFTLSAAEADAIVYTGGIADDLYLRFVANKV